MSLEPRPRTTFAEYLELEERSRNVRHEYIAGDVVAVPEGSVEHSALAASLVGMLFPHLRKGPCKVHGSYLRLRLESVDVATYADVSVVCEPLERAKDSPTHVTNPSIVVEVSSPSTEPYDREQKRLYYQTLPSLRQYVVVAQDRRRIETWRREGDDWQHTVHGPGQRVALPSIAFTFAVDDLYVAAAVAVP